MRLLARVRIEGFRSIRSAAIESFADFTSFAGINNSGKSNVLKALNAFFNDETDPGQPVNVDADYFRPDLRKKKRKRILVSVAFELPNNFKFRQGLKEVEACLSGRTFTIAKEWTRDNPLPTFYLNDKTVEHGDRQKLEHFLRLVKYRYIPNRVLPAELIRNEHQSLRASLVRRLAKSAKGDIETFKAIRTISARMIKSLTKRFDEACPDQGSVSLATPTSWSDVAFAFGYRLAQNGIEFSDTEQGSGIQSLLMLETLYLIDKDYFQQFGWRQAAIWGVEEPESSLHTSLEARVAMFLKQIADDPQSRLQLLCTTHSDLMVQYSGCTVVVERQDGESKFSPTQNPRDALELLSGAGVARWVHPILLWPVDPIILVEGQSDCEFLQEAFRFFKPKRQVRVVDLPLLDQSSASGGVEAMRQCIKENANAIRSRPPDAPVVVVLDWDAAKKQEEFGRLVPGSERYKVLVWPEQSANPRARKSFKGIERFHCDRILDLAIQRGAPIGHVNAQYSVETAVYGQVKQVLAEIVREGRMTESDFVHAKQFIEQLLREVGAA